MGSSLSKPIIGSRRRSSRDQQHHHAQYVITDPYSTSRRRGVSGEASSSSHRGQGTYTYTYTYPQYSLQQQYTPNQYGYQYPPTYSTYEPAPESAYYLGTETFPALHSLGTTQVKPTGKTRSRGRLPPEYASGVYNTNIEYNAPPPVYRHQHRGTTMGDRGYHISSERTRKIGTLEDDIQLLDFEFGDTNLDNLYIQSLLTCFFVLSFSQLAHLYSYPSVDSRID
ncbi:hypothetical protein EV426DRAFT_296323 [Tirmania nivea]|nr:hypothetical protein EV426DRAFT_296323 [Tirmania nivea]